MSNLKIEKWLDVVKFTMTFDQIQRICKYQKWGFDEYKYPSEQVTCRHNDNRDGSWGECIVEKCPLLKVGE